MQYRNQQATNLHIIYIILVSFVSFILQCFLMPLLYISVLNIHAFFKRPLQPSKMAILQRLRFIPTPSTLTHEQKAILQECIRLIRAEILIHQDRINASSSNLLTIVRCINTYLPRLQSHFYYYRYTIALEDMQNVVQVLGEKYAC
jgi:hypothetical protein